MPDTVFETPVPPTVHETDPRVDLTDSEQLIYEDVLKHFNDPTYNIPGVEQGELTEQERFWLSRDCLLRYLRATKWKNAAAAIGRLEDTLKWRRTYGVYDSLTANYVEPEAVTGKEILFGYDIHGRPAMYMFPSRQNTDDPVRQIQFVVWMLERGIDLMGPGVETIDLLINYGEKSKGPTFSTSRTVLSMLQEHYPERLGSSLVINVPFILNAFYKMINPFIDPVTREKMKFNPKLVEDKMFTAEMVMTEWGGTCDFAYVHEKYWPALVSLCEARRQAWMEKWRELGGKIGTKEWDYKTELTREPVMASKEVGDGAVEPSEVTTLAN